MTGPPADRIKNQYEALCHDVGFSTMQGRTLIELTGEDRAAFLNNLCTNELKSLTPGTGCEAFLTDRRGKVADYVYVYCGDRWLMLDTVPGQAEKILEGLDRYLIREDVQMHDRSGQWGELLIGGDRAEELLQQLLAVQLPTRPLGHADYELRGVPVSVRRVPFVGPQGFFLGCETEQLASCSAALQEAGAVECEPEAVEIARIEAGTPLFGRDVTSENLPQEVDRNEQAISFTKGCYLGQETIARLDALGHVNRSLRGLRFEGSEVPPPGAELTAGEKNAARVTSSCWSFRLGAPLAMGYVRRGHEPGATLHSEYGPAEVITLPVTA